MATRETEVGSGRSAGQFYERERREREAKDYMLRALQVNFAMWVLPVVLDSGINSMSGATVCVGQQVVSALWEKSFNLKTFW